MSIIIVQQKINQLMSMIDKIQTKVSSPSITNIIVNSNNPVVNFNNMAFTVININMNCDITSFTFQNSVANGTYKIYLQSTGFVMNKILNSNIKNNLSGNVYMVGYWIIDVYFNGTIYFLNFQDFT